MGRMLITGPKFVPDPFRSLKASLKLQGADWTTSVKASKLTITSKDQHSYTIAASTKGRYLLRSAHGTRLACSSDVQVIKDRLEKHLNAMHRVDEIFSRNQQLNAELSREAASRIKTVFKAAQEAVEMPKGFRYTAFRENKSEDTVLSTLMYTSAKLNKTQWVIKSGLMGVFAGESDGMGGIRTTDAWNFEPEYDPDGHGSDRGDNIKSSDRVYSFKPKMDSTVPPDKQTSYWLVDILSQMIDDILDNPPNRVYEFFLADGLLRKKNLASMEPGGLIRLIQKGAVTGPEVLKAKPSIWRRLLEKGFVTPEQVLNVLPNQLAWLTIHDYIPVERALKIDPSIKSQLEKRGVTVDDTTTDLKTPEELLKAVGDNQLTPRKAWSINPKVLKPMVEQKLITPEDAYKLDPSVLNWLLENHYIGREAALRLKPGIKREMTRKGVDWETLDANKLSSSYNYDEDWDAPWEFVKSKTFVDPDGWQDEIAWYTDGERHIFMLGGYDPDPQYADWICDSREEAEEWFNDYGNDDLDSSKKLNCETLQEFKNYYSNKNLDKIKKRIAKVGEFDNGKVMHGDWFTLTVDEAEEEAKSRSMAYPEETFYVQYDDVMVGSSPQKWKNGKQLNSSLNCSSSNEFYVTINQGELILRVFKNNRGEWREEKIYQDEDSDIYFSPTGYMGYLSPRDVMAYLKDDFYADRVALVSEEEVNSFLGVDWDDDDDWDDDEDLDSCNSLNADRNDATPENFLLALSLLEDDASAYDDLEGLAEDVGFTPDDVGGWEQWFLALSYADRATAWGYVSQAYYDEVGLDSSRAGGVDMQTLEQQLTRATLKWMTEPEQGFDADDGDFPARSYCAVDVSYNDDNRIRAEVRAEVSFEHLMDLAERLNPIVQRQDPNAYFDAVTAGVLDAYIDV